MAGRKQGVEQRKAISTGVLSQLVEFESLSDAERTRFLGCRQCYKSGQISVHGTNRSVDIF